MSGVPVFIWHFAQAEFDEARWELRVGCKLQDVEPRPLEVLLHLLRHAGEVVTREEILEAIYGHQHIGDGALANAIGKLRRVLADEAQVLIATVHRVGYKLTAPVRRVAVPGLDRRPLSLKVGDPVPRRENWKLLRPLGAGRDTEVWLAQHEKTRESRVFKFSPDGLRLSALKREATLFRVIREALGERADFVKVLDWNFEEAPFFLECEYGGENLAEWAEGQGGLGTITLAQRVELALRIAEAVAAAHSAGVLHKDVKPANVLMDRDAEGHWRPCLTDFGSGRLFEPDRLAQLGITQLGFTQTQGISGDSHTGTPLYLAPEVIAGQTPTALSDVYALGVMLYQLAVGDLRRPMAPGWEHEIEDEILRGDIARAAAGDPAKRLGSAAELAARLHGIEERRRLLIRERETSKQAAELRARLERARARRPWLIAAAITLAAGLGLGLWQYQATVRARDDARRQAQIAEAVTQFFDDDILGAASPYALGNRRELTVREAVDRAAAKLDGRFPGQPKVEGTIRFQLGTLYTQAGNLGAAQAQLGRAAELFRAADQPEQLKEVQYLLAGDLIFDSRLAEARTAIQRFDEQWLGPGHSPRDTEISYALHSLYERNMERYTQAMPYAQGLLTTALRGRPDQASGKAIRRTALAQIDTHLGHFEEANHLFQDALADLGKVEDAHDTMTAITRGAYGVSLYLQGRKADAEAELTAAHAQLLDTLGPNDDSTLEAQQFLGLIDLDRGRMAQGLEAIKAAHLGYVGRFGASSRFALIAEGYLGIAELAGGDHGAGVQDLQQAHAGLAAMLGEQAPSAQLFAFALLEEAARSGAGLSDAETLLQSLAAEPLRAAAPAFDWDSRLDLARGRLDLALGKKAEAASLLRRTVAHLRQTAPESVDLGEAERTLTLAQR